MSQEYFCAQNIRKRLTAQCAFITRLLFSVLSLHKAQAAVSYSSMKQQCSVWSLYHPNVLNYTNIIKQ